MFGFALLLTGLVFIVTLLVAGIVTALAVSRISSAAPGEVDAIMAGAVAAGGLALLVPAALSIVVTAVLQGIVSLEVARATLGEKLKLGGLWRAARGRIGALIGYTLLLTAAIGIGIAIIALVIGLLVAFGGTAGIAIAVLLGIAAGLGAAALTLWLGTRLSFVPSVLMIERLPLRAAVSRSWSLTIGFFWRTLGIQLLVTVIVQTVSSIITTPLSLIASFTLTFTNPNGDPNASIAAFAVVYVLSAAVSLVFGAIAAVVQSATSALLYIDTRMRKEGLDLELSRFVEARQAGDASVTDPYLLRPTTA